tara:strand:- start:24163 stop:24375 length:213 start_codon:yes stop_codon:yes gene_type:complete
LDLKKDHSSRQILELHDLFRYDILNIFDDSANLYKKYVIPVNITIIGVIVYKKDIFLNLIIPAYNENITG